MNSHKRPAILIQLDTKVLLLAMAAGSILCLVSGSGFDAWPVFREYIGFFGFYYVLFFIGSRIYLIWVQNWTPTTSLGQRLYNAIGGAPDDDQTARTDWEVARGTLLFFAALSVYSNIKVRIPIINSTLHDGWIAALDQTLFFTDFVPFGQYVVANPLLDTFLTRAYFHGYLFMAILATLLYIRQDFYRIRLLFMSAAYIYLGGILITAAMPTVGPWLAFAERWSWLEGHYVFAVQQELEVVWNQAITVRENGHLGVSPSGEGFHALAFGGVAALPSLHVGHMALITMIAWQSKYLFWYAIAVFEVLLITAVATVAYGWHYLLDAPAGILLAIACVKLSEYLIRGKKMATESNSHAAVSENRP